MQVSKFLVCLLFKGIWPMIILDVFWLFRYGFFNYWISYSTKKHCIIWTHLITCIFNDCFQFMNVSINEFSCLSFEGLSSLLLMSAFIGLLVVDVTYPEDKRDQNFYLSETFFSCLFFFVVIPILFIAKNENMTHYVFNKLYHSNTVKEKIVLLFTKNQVIPLSQENNLIWVK